MNHSRPGERTLAHMPGTEPVRGLAKLVARAAGKRPHPHKVGAKAARLVTLLVGALLVGLRNPR